MFLQFLDYVSKVLLQEAMFKLSQDILGITREEAEKLLG